MVIFEIYWVKENILLKLIKFLYIYVYILVWQLDSLKLQVWLAFMIHSVFLLAQFLEVMGRE